MPDATPQPTHQASHEASQATGEVAGDRKSARGGKPGWRTLVVCLLILGVAAGLAAWAMGTEPTAQKAGAVRKSAMLVDVIEVSRGTRRPTLVATGTVAPARDLVLRPQVSGTVVSRASGFEPGGFVDAGDVLFRLEAADYRNAVAQADSALKAAEAALRIEMGRQRVAEEEYAFFNRGADGGGERQLMLREPQLETARSDVAAAKAVLDQARLSLRRTTIRAPFDAHVLSREVSEGSQVASGDPLGRIVGIERYWVIVNLPRRQLSHLRFGEDAGAGARVRIRSPGAWPEGAEREGRALRWIGALEETTRLARVVVAVVDPLARQSETQGPPLVVGEFVEAHLEAEPLDDVVALPRDYLRDGDTVWVMREGKLEVRQADVVMRDAKHAYVRGGLSDGDRVVTTNLATVREGAALQTRRPSEGMEDRGRAGAADAGRP